MITTQFGAMGTTIEVHADDARRVAATRRWFSEVESVASRFLVDSALSVLNRDPRPVVEVPRLLARILGAAASVRQLTHGLVDAAVANRVVDWGYDRTFGDLAPRPAPPPPGVVPGWSIDGCFVSREPGVALDVGGIAKGWAADRAIERGLAAIVSAGGDVMSSHPDAAVRVIGPSGDVVADVALGARGLATSSVARRRWAVGDREAHHLIDPRSGAPAVGPIVSATAVAASATLAEAAAKAVLLHGVDGLDWAGGQDWVEGALVVWEDGTVYATVDLEVAA